MSKVFCSKCREKSAEIETYNGKILGVRCTRCGNYEYNKKNLHLFTNGMDNRKWTTNTTPLDTVRDIVTGEEYNIHKHLFDDEEGLLF